nr:retrotransposon Orf1 [Tanacetum cinerariifolium]
MYMDDIKLLKHDIYLRDLNITELKRKLELATKEKDEVQLTVQKFENSSKSLSKLLDSQILNKCKTGLGYNVVPPLYTGNFIPPKPDLVYPSLDDFVDESVSESIVEKQTVDSNEPKTIKKENEAPIINDWVSKSEEEDEPKSQSVKHNFTKIEFVKSKEQVKSPRKTTVKQNKKPRQHTHKPTGNQRNLNNLLSQRLGSNFEMYNKACYECGSFNHLQKQCNHHQRKFQNQKMTTAKAKNINGVAQIHTKVDGKKVIISKATIRRDFKFKDEGGINCLSNGVIFKQLTLIGLEKKRRSRTHGRKRLYKVGLSARVESSAEEQKDHRRFDDSEMFDTSVLDGEEVIEKEVLIKEAQDVQNMEKKDQISFDEQEARRLQDKIDEEDRLVEEKAQQIKDKILAWDNVQAMMDADYELSASSKRAGDELDQERSKKQKMEDDKEFEELKRCLEIIPDDEDDVTIDATPLSIKTLIIDYKIYKEGKKSYFQNFKADGNSQITKLGEEDASTQGRNIADIDADVEITLVDETTKDQGRSDNQEIFDTSVLDDEEVVEKEVLLKDAQDVQNMKKKDQISFDEQEARRLQAKIDEQDRLAEEKAQQIENENLAWDNVQVMIDADNELAARLQEEEQRELTVEEKSRLFVELMDKRKKHFAKLRAEKQRRKPLTKAEKEI